MESYQHICLYIHQLFHPATAPVQHRLRSPGILACYCAPRHDHRHRPVKNIEDN